jgi:hypothetical protein
VYRVPPPPFWPCEVGETSEGHDGESGVTFREVGCRYGYFDIICSRMRAQFCAGVLENTELFDRISHWVVRVFLHVAWGLTMSA